MNRDNKSKIKTDRPTEQPNHLSHLIVIGGTSGIGLALALAHQQHGWQVSVVGHSEATKEGKRK